MVEPFLKGLHTHPLPNAGVDTILSVVPSEVDAGQVYSFPLPNPKKLAEIPTDVSSNINCVIERALYTKVSVWKWVYISLTIYVEPN